jgi:hypothetical protein
MNMGIRTGYRSKPVLRQPGALYTIFNTGSVEPVPKPECNIKHDFENSRTPFSPKPVDFIDNSHFSQVLMGHLHKRTSCRFVGLSLLYISLYIYYSETYKRTTWTDGGRGLENCENLRIVNVFNGLYGEHGLRILTGRAGRTAC